MCDRFYICNRLVTVKYENCHKCENFHKSEKIVCVYIVIKNHKYEKNHIDCVWHVV